MDQDLGNEHTIGAKLRRAREEKGLSLEDVAKQTRIPLRHLSAIEDGRWDSLPAITYSVGFARAYANAVGLNGAEVGREIRERLGGSRPPATAPEYYEPADPARVPPRSIAIAVSVILALFLIGYLIWRSNLSEEQALAPVAAAPQAQAPVQPQPPVQPAVPTGQVTLTATEEVWVRIGGGAGGAALFQGILNAGQRFDVPATAVQPTIRTGRPQVLRVSVGGQDLGQLEPRERTVANLSLRAEDLAARLQAAQGGVAGQPAPVPLVPPAR